LGDETNILLKRPVGGFTRLLATGLLGAALAFASCLASGERTSLPELLEQARTLSAAGRADEYIGVVEFDYALGRAALDSGRPDRATLAFGRVLAVDPKHAGASIDMGRAYLALGNREQARAIFGGLLALDPPAAVREQLAAYLAQAGGASERRTFVSGFVAAIAGHDSNVNAAAAQARVFVPLFGSEVDLASANVRKADNYAGLSAGLDITHQIDERILLVGGVEAADRSNARESQFDLGAVAARIGAARVWQHFFARAQLLTARSYLGGADNRDVRALALDASEFPGAGPQWSGYAQAGTIRYLPQG
jgi:tetratricopeptide (TPR) repeat protein